MQNSVALVCLFAAKSALPDVVKFSKRFNSDVAMDWLPVNMLFCAMLMTGFLSLKALAVPMVTIFKNLTNVVILTGDWYFHGASISRGCDDAVHSYIMYYMHATPSSLLYDPRARACLRSSYRLHVLDLTDVGAVLRPSVASSALSPACSCVLLHAAYCAGSWRQC